MTQRASLPTENHSVKLLSAMDNLRASEDLCDVVLSVGKLKIPAHRVVLAALSPYFRAMFSSGLRESHQSSVTLHEVDPEAAKALVDHSYSGNVEIDEKNVISLFKAAHLLQFSDVLCHCCDWLSGHVDESNCLEWGLISWRYNLSDSEIEWRTDRWVALRLSQMAKCNDDSFSSLPFEYLNRLLAMDELKVDSEEEVEDMALKWVRHDEENRQRYTDDLLACVRKSLLPCSEAESDITESNEEESTDDDSQKSKSDIPAQRRTGNLGVVLAVGGFTFVDWNKQTRTSLVEYYDPVFEEWVELPSLNTPRYAPAVVSVADSVYVLGGNEGICDAERYDRKNKTWISEVEPMKNPRHRNQLVAFDGFIYGLGSSECGEKRCQCERYDPFVNKWHPIKAVPLKKSQYVIGAVVFDGWIHVACGGESSSYFEFLRYDHMANVWFETSIRYRHHNILHKRPHIFSALGNDRLLIYDGSGHRLIELSEGKATVKQLSQLDNCPLQEGAVAAGNGRLYFVGGVKQKKKGLCESHNFCWLDTAEPESKVEKGTLLIHRRSLCGAAVVDRSAITM